MSKRWFKAALTVAATAALLTAGTTAIGTAKADPVKITMWDIPESEPYTAWWRKHVEDFNKAHPDIQVTLEVFETEAYRSKIASALSAGTTADIFYLAAGPQGFQALRDGQARPLAGILDSAKFTESSMTACSTDGKLACMPLYVAPNLIYYNKTISRPASTLRSGRIPRATWRSSSPPASPEGGPYHPSRWYADGRPGTMYLWAPEWVWRADGAGPRPSGTNGRTFSNSRASRRRPRRFELGSMASCSVITASVAARSTRFTSPGDDLPGAVDGATS